MTDKDIKKALAECSKHTECEACHFMDECYDLDVLHRNFLDLINRQEKKIEELETALFNLGEAYSVYEETTGLKQAKVEAYKEFAEILKTRQRYAKDVFNHTIEVVVRVEDIDKVLEKMEEYSEE